MAEVAGFVPWAELGMRILVRLISARLMIGTDHQDTGQFAMRAGGRLKCKRLQTRQSLSAILAVHTSSGDYPERSHGLERVRVCETRQTGSDFVERGLYFIVQEPSGYMPMVDAVFRLERRVKWRTTSTSDSSGSGRSSRSKAGMGASGTSGSGYRTPLRPGTERSHNKGSVIGNLRKDIHQQVDIVSGIHLGNSYQHMICQLWVVLPKIVPTQDASLSSRAFSSDRHGQRMTNSLKKGCSDQRVSRQ